MMLPRPVVEFHPRPVRVAPAPRPPVLLTMAGHAGTLAAARCFGNAGIHVTVASDSVLRPAAWSRHAKRTVRCPRPSDPVKFLEWLLEFGKANPGHFLYPTCDDFAYLFARHREELSRNFVLYQPPVEVILDLLDKKSLYEACGRAGVAVPHTFFAPTDADAYRVAAEAQFPLLIKPRTQVMFPTAMKGWRVEKRTDLAQSLRAYRERNFYIPAILEDRPDVAHPMLQTYHPEAEGGIESIAGFIDEHGGLFAARAARKLLQRPRRVGIGICFEHAPLDVEAREAIRRLCKQVGYHGVFEAEFIRSGNERLLIDFNPRFYGQMGFEIARGLPSPLLAYLAAVGDRTALREEVAKAQRTRFDEEPPIYLHRFALSLQIFAQRVSGRMPRDVARRWKEWYAAHRRIAVDAAFDKRDPVPGLLEALSLVWGAARHPRGFLRSILLDK
ncbi:MAG: carbamoyl-phosphate synthase [Myxococcales bacterium]